jgi:hypothetical protein
MWIFAEFVSYVRTAFLAMALGTIAFLLYGGIRTSNMMASVIWFVVAIVFCLLVASMWHAFRRLKLPHAEPFPQERMWESGEGSIVEEPPLGARPLPPEFLSAEMQLRESIAELERARNLHQTAENEHIILLLRDVLKELERMDRINVNMKVVGRKVGEKTKTGA